MSEPYQIFVLIPEGLPAAKVVHSTNEVLKSLNGELDEDSVLFLNETVSEEVEPELVTNSSTALDKLANWPTLGSIAYTMSEGLVNISFEGLPNTGLVEAILISVPEKAFERGGQESKNRYIALAYQLHERFKAKRTIMDWGLEFKGVDWKEEIDRLGRGEFVGNYILVDLRTHGSMQNMNCDT
jgi:hypothetical protein